MSSQLKIAFFATMSAGKTTCINALLGTELLHSANEATTATITTIRYGNMDEISVYDKSNNLVNRLFNIDSESIRLLNASEEIETIHIESNFNISKCLNFIDTPGPNNSRDNHHAELAYKFLDNNDVDYILYLINATQPFIQDDLIYLKYIANKVDINKVVFIINKVDEFDVELESVKSFFSNLKEYLSNFGFISPVIFATSAYHALILKKLAKQESLTRKEIRVLSQLIEDDVENQFLQHLNLSKEVAFQVERRNYFEFLGEDFKDKEILNRIYCKTGLPYFEEFIEQNIQKLSMKG